MHRVIKELAWAAHSKRPPGLPFGRCRGTAAIGLRYERKVAAQFPSAIHGQWWNFCDAAGLGYCQTDVVLLLFGHLIILECKLTDCLSGRAQLAELYVPVVSKALARPAHGIIVARNAAADSDPRLVVGTMAEALRLTCAKGVIPTLQWLGKARLPQS
jgi:hypothetical protein